MPAAEPVVTELTIDGSGAERGQAQYVRAMAAAQAQMERTLAVNARLAESYSQQARVSQQVAAANDNVSRSFAQRTTMRAALPLDGNRRR
jgi:phage-related tail protein